MNIVKIMVFLWFSLLVNAWSQAPALTKAEQISLNLTGKMKARELSITQVNNLVSNDREEVISLLRQVESGRDNIKNYSSFATNARVALLKLNDRPTIEKIMSNFREYQSGKLGDYSEDIAAAAQPLLIPDLAEHLFLPASAYDAYEKERVKHDGGDVTQTSPVFLADELIILIVRDSDQFSEATREWARAMWRNSTKHQKIREILRAWWNENKQLIQSGNFGAVKPGALPPEDEPAPRATPKTAAHPSTPTPTPSPMPQVSPARAELPTLKEPHSNSALLFSLAAIILGGVGFIAYRSRRR